MKEQTKNKRGSLRPLERLVSRRKLDYTRELIRCWVDSWGVDGVYVAYSGGKDSEVLLHIARSMFPGIKAVFSNTGLEFPEIVKHVKAHNNVTMLRPKLPFHKVVEKYGWPVVSKLQSQYIDEYRNTNSQKLKELRWRGSSKGNFKIAEKWKFLVNSPFKISHKCCSVLKKNPFKKFEKETGLKPMIGIMSGDSYNRQSDISRRGCNVYDAKAPQSRPLANWTEEDVYDYIVEFKVEICSIYSKGYDRTGCVFCMYGLEQEEKSSGENRFQKMRVTHPKLHDYCVNKLGAGTVMDFMGVAY